MHIKDTLRRLLLALVLFAFSAFAQAQTQLIVELLDFSESKYTIPEDGGFHFEDGFLIIDDDGEDNHSISIFSIRKISLHTQETTKQEEVDAFSFSVYPNPTTDYITVNTGLNNEQVLSVYSSTGVLYLEFPCWTGEPLNVSSLPAGLYVICVNGQSLKFCKL